MGTHAFFSWDVFNEAFAPLLAAVKYQTFRKAFFHPCFLLLALLAGHGAADMFVINIFFCDSDVVHLETILLFRLFAN